MVLADAFKKLFQSRLLQPLRIVQPALLRKCLGEAETWTVNVCGSGGRALRRDLPGTDGVRGPTGGARRRDQPRDQMVGKIVRERYRPFKLGFGQILPVGARE